MRAVFPRGSFAGFDLTAVLKSSDAGGHAAQWYSTCPAHTWTWAPTPAQPKIKNESFEKVKQSPKPVQQEPVLWGLSELWGTIGRGWGGRQPAWPQLV